MKIDCVLTSCNLDPMYIDFVPIFIQAWNKLYPYIDVKIILIADKIPEKLIEYSNYLILFPYCTSISSAFISQYIRLLYPAILNYENGILITDIDIIPMNKTYFSKNIDPFFNDRFIIYRDVLIDDYKEVAMCYNVATKELWSEVSNINTIDDIKNRLLEVYSSIDYDDSKKHGGGNWNKDQTDLYNYLANYSKLNDNKVIILNDKSTGFRRLDRNTFQLTNELIAFINRGGFSDYHMYRPYNDYKEINDKIVSLLTRVS